MIERVARKLHQRNSYVVNAVKRKEWIQNYELVSGNFNIEDVDKNLVDEIPYPTQMGKVYMRLILDTLEPDENYIDGMIRAYNEDGF